MLRGATPRAEEMAGTAVVDVSNFCPIRQHLDKRPFHTGSA
jgi:hypothetical protein